MQITKAARIQAITGVVYLYRDGKPFQNKGIKFTNPYDEIEPWTCKNLEGYIGYFKNKPYKAYFNICGSNDPADWKYNLKFWSKRIDIKNDPYELITPYDTMTNSPIKAHRGFVLCYKETGLRDFLLKTAEKYNEIELGGHSLGAAMDILGAVDIQKNKIIGNKNIIVFPFSCPPVFNTAGIESYNRRVPNTMLYWYRNDMVVKNLIQKAIGQRHVDHRQEYHVGKMKWFEWIAPWNWWFGTIGYTQDHWPQKLQKQMKIEIPDD